MTPASADYRRNILRHAGAYIVQDVDGHFYYWPPSDGSAVSSAALRVIADELDRLNEPIIREIDAHFDTVALSGEFWIGEAWSDLPCLIYASHWYLEFPQAHDGNEFSDCKEIESDLWIDRQYVWDSYHVAYAEAEQ